MAHCTWHWHRLAGLILVSVVAYRYLFSDLGAVSAGRVFSPVKMDTAQALFASSSLESGTAKTKECAKGFVQCSRGDQFSPSGHEQPESHVLMANHQISTQRLIPRPSLSFSFRHTDIPSEKDKMQPFVSNVKKLTTIVHDATTKHTATVIFLHGLGDSGAGWAFMGEKVTIIG